MPSLPVNRIFPRRDARMVDPQKVEQLAESMREIGLISPIRVRPIQRYIGGIERDAYEISAGNHRHQAADKLGWETIEATVVDDNDLDAELIMIDENLCRAELSLAERAAYTNRRKVVYLEKHPETAAGAAQAKHLKQGPVSAKNAPTESTPSFVADTVAKTGKAKRTVEIDAQRGENIAEDVLRFIANTDLDTSRYLDELKKVPRDKQRAKAERDLANKGKKSKKKGKGKKNGNSAPDLLTRDEKKEAAKRAAETIVALAASDYAVLTSLKADLYAAGAKNIGDALTALTADQPIMDARHAPSPADGIPDFLRRTA